MIWVRESMDIHYELFTLTDEQTHVTDENA